MNCYQKIATKVAASKATELIARWSKHQKSINKQLYVIMSIPYSSAISQSLISIVFLLVFLSINTSANSQDKEKIFRKGVNLYDDGMYKEALIYIDSSLNMDSSLYQRFHLRADIKSALKMYKAAIEDMTRCINKCKGPNRMSHVSDYYLRRSELHYFDKNQNQAFLDIHKSIEFNPKNWKAYNIRSFYYKKSGNTYDALDDLSTSISINDNEANTYVARGELRADVGDIAGACVDFKKLSGWGFDEYDLWIKDNCSKK
ncbi:MAG: hypothetical protein AAFQ94_22360 [Bacteroidota bacterium]